MPEDKRNKDFETPFYQGLQSIETHNYLEAIGHFSEVIRKKRDFAPAYVYRGYAYRGLGVYSQAIENFTIAIELNPEDAQIYKDRGYAYRELKNYEEAEKDLVWASSIEEKKKDVNAARDTQNIVGLNGSYKWPSKKILVDASNVALYGVKKDKGEKARIKNILLVVDALKEKGFNDIQVIADANLRHYIDDPSLFEELVDRLIIQAPAGIPAKADKWILEYAEKLNAKVVSGDMFSKERMKSEWLKNNIDHLRVTFMIVDNIVTFYNLI
jgi:tetratricopeptide (TPR) repeat protein